MDPCPNPTRLPRIVNNHFHALGGDACEDEMATAPELSVEDSPANPNSDPNPNGTLIGLRALH